MPTRFLTHAAVWTMTFVISGTLLAVPVLEAAQSAHAMYTRALGRERGLRTASNRVSVTQIRGVVAAYEAVVRRYPRSGYSDNALWQGANLALLAFERFGQPADRRTALRLLQQLRSGYPSSSLVARAGDVLRQLETARTAPSPAPPPSPSKPVPRAAASTPVPATPPAAAPPVQAREKASAVAVPSDPTAALEETDTVPAAESPGESSIVTIRDIRRTILPDGVRVSIEMDGESLYRAERLENPRRVFFDLKNTRTVLSLQDATVKFDDDIVREVRLGRHPKDTTRIVMDLEAVEDYSVFTLYSPFRLVVDFRRAGAASRPPSPAAPPQSDVLAAAAKEPVPLLARPAAPPLAPPPAAAAANANGQFSIARQLGLGVSRVVLDAGHGGHDPGAKANGVSEAELVLDVTLRLRALLEKQPGIEVTLTRDKDVFVPLEERTAIANREGADLFLSIHANASRNQQARGIETYFLNFASNREAEAVAARENSASGRTMHSLPSIVRAIALNNKIDESRDFASMVQQSMVKRLAARNKEVRDLGVKQAPFVVLIGASMPSVLAEISFVTHKGEATLLKSAAYRQQIAESLRDGVLRYQASLKGVRTVAALE